MKKITNSILNFMSTRLGFVLTLLLLYWFKTMWAYSVDFNLDIQGPYQIFLAVINPLPISLLFIGLALYIKRTKLFYSLAFGIYLLLFIWLISNSIYYREFTDFVTVNTMLASSKVSAGLGAAALELFRPWDVIYILDFPILAFFFFKKWIRMDNRPFNKRASFAVTSLSAMLFSANLFLAEIDRPELLTRGFSNYYVVRALGLPAFLGYSANQTYAANKERSKASEADLKPVEEYIQQHYAKPNPEYFGMAKGRNVIYIHLESFQQFLIDYKLKVDDKEYEVTPFLNSLYHSKETFAFSNVFNQVKAGKTSDAETMIETGLFGLNQGSFMVNYGGTNTQQAAPFILSKNGYNSSAVFHGNAGSFWNRNTAYKQWGYNYFFDASYFTKQNSSNSFQYGLNDKYMLKDSIKYLERLQQPFYTKFITVSNHYPYTTSLSGDDLGFPLAKTQDETINGYFATANYLDSSIKAFFDYLKESGLYKNSIIVLYGDHYGISNSRNPALAPLLGKNSETWSSYDNAMLQRVPYMVVIPGMDKGGIIDTYGGEIDMLPTLEHLLGIESNKFLQVGQDMLSPEHDQIVAFRSANYFVTPEYTSYSGRTYYTKTGEEITNPDEKTKEELDKIREAANLQLKISDSIQTGDLLRFFKGNDLGKVNPEDYSYTNSFKALKKIEKEKGDKSTSLYNQRGNQSTVDLFKAPTYKELHPENDSSSSTETSSSSSK
ncbi:sulfatase-like hydrolase/transferase [Streptococcus parasanguinis]|uniref:LTA synthase family protein n=1 Tax=Streptococcus parasanguinis TaxID=1318 RepID=UPI00131112FD|nr:LTA synthase family protein [Streptococcus parasanguinis]MCB6479024.1 LTA synthase family protein [Streptococcus parasanguinis]MCQ5185882.1 LTA synthase family protein [Streptococcus parasanguinis]MTR54846.1 sulfatase-like hydrolase/transferase [Streptococcus parasanguinis]MTR56783.1 sulfatase-like hydrolase/transferase [Streptococcus parasanguinis]MTR61633.1 sulfatase-like hydrolase/transferase [Streptococcus parasanguinis]